MDLYDGHQDLIEDTSNRYLLWKMNQHFADPVSYLMTRPDQAEDEGHAVDDRLSSFNELRASYHLLRNSFLSRIRFGRNHNAANGNADHGNTSLSMLSNRPIISLLASFTRNRNDLEMFGSDVSDAYEEDEDDEGSFFEDEEEEEGEEEEYHDIPTSHDDDPMVMESASEEDEEDDEDVSVDLHDVISNNDR